MTSVSASHIIARPTQSAGSGRPGRGSNPLFPDQESCTLPTEQPPPQGGGSLMMIEKQKLYMYKIQKKKVPVWSRHQGFNCSKNQEKSSTLSNSSLRNYHSFPSLAGWAWADCSTTQNNILLQSPYLEYYQSLEDLNCGLHCQIGCLPLDCWKSIHPFVKSFTCEYIYSMTHV